MGCGGTRGVGASDTLWKLRSYGEERGKPDRMGLGESHRDPRFAQRADDQHGRLEMQRNTGATIEHVGGFPSVPVSSKPHIFVIDSEA